LPELHDLAADPQEQRNLCAQQRAGASARSAARSRDERRGGAGGASVDRCRAEARLRALGYVVSSAPKPLRTYTHG
jgi:hypothetical protein